MGKQNPAEGDSLLRERHAVGSIHNSGCSKPSEVPVRTRSFSFACLISGVVREFFLRLYAHVPTLKLNPQRRR
jgi:hypothetical protein